jgi:hypothetical protein
MKMNKDIVLNEFQMKADRVQIMIGGGEDIIKKKRRTTTLNPLI